MFVCSRDVYFIDGCDGACSAASLSQLDSNGQLWFLRGTNVRVAGAGFGTGGDESSSSVAPAAVPRGPMHASSSLPALSEASRRLLAPSLRLSMEGDASSMPSVLDMASGTVATPTPAAPKFRIADVTVSCSSRCVWQRARVATLVHANSHVCMCVWLSLPLALRSALAAATA